jgi:hydrogenase/urease accessory protein HupE
LSFINPLLLEAAMMCGVAMHVAGFYLPAADLVVSVSVLIAGLMLIIEERIPPTWWMSVFALEHGGTGLGGLHRPCSCHIWRAS